MFHDVSGESSPLLPGEISREDAILMIENSKGKFFSVTFEKRTEPGALRVLKCQYGQNPAYPVAKYDLKSKGLVGVFCRYPDPKNGVSPGNRSFPIEGLQILKIGGKTYRVV